MQLSESVRNLGFLPLAFTRRHKTAGRDAGVAADAPPPPGLFQNIALLAIVIAIQALVAIASLNALSTLRVFVEAQGLWSKAEQSATMFLYQYLDHGDEQDYRSFQSALDTALDLNAARREAEGPEPDMPVLAASLERLGVDPDEIPGAIFVYLHFRQSSLLLPAIAIWRQTDAALTELAMLGQVIRDEHQRVLWPKDVDDLKAEVRDTDMRLLGLASTFSKVLGRSARDATRLVTFANIGLAIILITLVIWRMRRLFRRSQLFERALRNEKEQAQVTLQAIGDAVIRTDASGRVQYANRAAERLIGQGLAEGRRLSSLVALADASGKWCDCPIETILTGKSTACSLGSGLVLELPSGSTPVSLQCAPFVVDGEAKGTVLILRDMTREHDLIGRLSWQASHDELTGLANRRELERRLNGRIAHSFEDGAEDALLLFDLDQFKLVNDSYGHAAGDQVLREVATLLKLELPDDSLPVRLGGDEFAAFLPDCDGVQAMEIAERLRDGVQSLSFSFGGRPIRTSASIGARCEHPRDRQCRGCPQPRGYGLLSRQGKGPQSRPTA